MRRVWLVKFGTSNAKNWQKHRCKRAYHGRMFRRLANPETPFDIGVCSLDQIPQSARVDRGTRSQFDVPHKLAVALKQHVRIVQLGTVEEADVDMRGKGIDVTKFRFAYT